MAESSYWKRFWRKRMSRRRLLAGAALTGTGLAAAAIIGCEGGGEGGTPSPGRTVTPQASPVAEAIIDARREFIPAPPGMKGGVLRYIGFDPVVLDRYDPHQTQFGPMYSNLSAVFSKLYMYKSHEEPTWDNIVPDLADGIPEMIGDPPDTYVIKLRRGVRFHDTPQIRKNFPSLAGRELTADDVIYSFERQRNRNSPQWAYFYRSSQYETIDTIERIDDYTIRIRTKGPIAPFYHFLADTNAMIIPKEIVDQDKDTVDVGDPPPEQRMIGTGPFMWGELKWGIEFRAVRNPDWFGWDDPDLGRPYLDGYVASSQGVNDDASREALFRQKKVDVVGFVDNPQWIYDLKNEMPELVLFIGHSSGFVNSRLKVYCKPFDDWRVRKALHLATDRRQVVDVIFSGVGYVQGPVGGAIKFWALPEEELMSIPGYRQGPAREEDIAEARRLFEAAGKPELPEIWNADQPAYIPRFMPAYAQTLKQNLGVEIRTLTQPYSRIAEGLLRGCDQIAMGWAYDNGWIDLDDWLYPYFHSTGSKNSMKVNDPELDRLLDAQRREFDIERRRDLGYQIQRYILGMDPSGSGKPVDPAPLGAFSRLDYAAPGGPSVSWPYYKNRVSFPWFGNNYWLANAWLDRGDPTYQGRPD